MIVIGMLVIAGSYQRPVFGQAQLADELVLLSKGQRDQTQQRDDLHMGGSPGSPGSRFTSNPGGGDPALRERSPGQLDPNRKRTDVLSAASTPFKPARYNQGSQTLAAPVQVEPLKLPLSGSLEIPESSEDGPENAMTLDTAIEILSSNSLDLRTKYQEIPKAEADILTAGLRGNPLVFASADDVPYGNYTPQRPGEKAYGVTIIQPLDVNNKRSFRILAAQQAQCVVQAQYQDAVRLEIERLYTSFVDVLAARDEVRYIEASLGGLAALTKVVERQVEARQASKLEVERLMIQRESAELALAEAQNTLLKSKQALALLLNSHSDEQTPLEIRGAIRSQVDSLPPVDELIGMARANRPDLRAYHLGIHRAESEVGLATKERYPDMFVLYTPYGLRDNSATGGANATSWGLSAMASVPLFNRNQGNIRRSEINVAQTRTEYANLMRQIEVEVRNAAKDQDLALNAVQRIEKAILPRARNIRDLTRRSLDAGEVDTAAVLAAQKEYVDVVRQYRDALIRHRRAALRLNTVVAMRIVP